MQLSENKCPKSLSIAPLRLMLSILLVQCFVGNVYGDDENVESTQAAPPPAGYGEWCDERTACDESNLMATWNCNNDHTCECPMDRKGLTYDSDIKGCAVAVGFKCNPGDPDDKCVTNADCTGGKCTCGGGKTCISEVKPPSPAKVPEGYVPTKYDSKALGISELKGGGGGGASYPYSLNNVPASSDADKNSVLNIRILEGIFIKFVVEVILVFNF